MTDRKVVPGCARVRTKCVEKTGVGLWVRLYPRKADSRARNKARNIASVHEEMLAMFKAKWKEKQVELTATYESQR